MPLLATTLITLLARPAMQAPQISNVRVVSPEAPQFGLVDVRVGVAAQYTNPSDSSQVALEARITAPSGKVVVVPGYERVGEWFVRFSPQELGAHTGVLTLKTPAGTASYPDISFTAVEAISKGPIRVSQKDRRFFEYPSGEPFFMVGMNHPKMPADAVFKARIQKFSEAGGNTLRIFISHGAGISLTPQRSSAFRIDPASADRLDAIIQAASGLGLKTILVIETPFTLGPGWASSPYNLDFKGPLTHAGIYWNNPVIDRILLDRVRYILARYGAYSDLVGIELWHEPDLAHRYEEAKYLPWHETMLRSIRAMDPYGKLLSVGLAKALGIKDLDRMPVMDFAQTHLTDVPDIAPQVSLMQARKVSYDKPHLVTMLAAARAEDERSFDPKGLQFHDAIWASATSGSAGTAMPWWPDLVEEKDQYWMFAHLTTFIKGVDWTGENFRQVRPSFAFAEPPSQPLRKDLVIDGPVSITGTTEYNLPRRVRIVAKGVEWGTPVAGIMHGKRNRAYLHNPITFILDQPRSTVLDVEIGEVSGEGGATLQISVDGRVVASKTFADPDGRVKVQPRMEYRGSLVSAPIPGGRHTVVVASVGNDWVRTTYRFRDLLERKEPALIGFALVGDRTTLAWARLADRSWRRVALYKRNVPVAEPSLMGLTGLASGKWNAQIFDTWTGKAVSNKVVTVAVDGTVKVPLPEIARDYAVKLTRR